MSRYKPADGAPFYLEGGRVLRVGVLRSSACSMSGPPVASYFAGKRRLYSYTCVHSTKVQISLHEVLPDEQIGLRLLEWSCFHFFTPCLVIVYGFLSPAHLLMHGCIHRSIDGLVPVLVFPWLQGGWTRVHRPLSHRPTQIPNCHVTRRLRDVKEEIKRKTNINSITGCMRCRCRCR